MSLWMSERWCDKLKYDLYKKLTIDAAPTSSKRFIPVRQDFEVCDWGVCLSLLEKTYIDRYIYKYTSI